MKPFAITLDVGTSLANHTGSWRTLRPEYQDFLPPCNSTCPAGENIQAWLFHAEEGNYRAAWDEIVSNNPMPATMGRACYHTCEGACNRAKIDSSVGIHAVERFLGDLAIAQKWKVEVTAKATGKRVLVIGAGPGGLSAAYHLRRLGHAVTIVDSHPLPGGMLRYGIPKYRLPREVLDAEIGRIAAMGVEFKFNTRIDDVAAAKKDGNYDAVFMAIGAWVGKRVNMPSDNSVQILDALEMLSQFESEPEKLRLSGHVVVFGGGNVAMDVARTARRLGCKVTVLVRRSRALMPAHSFEIVEAEEEGVEFLCLHSVKSAEKGKLLIERNVLDDTNAARPTGETFLMPADSLVMAVGQDVDLHFTEKLPAMETVGGSVKIDRQMATTVDGIFAGGDMTPNPRTMTAAIGDGKKAARNIDAWLRGEAYAPPPKHPVAEAKRLNTWYYGDASAAMQPILDSVRRQSGFAEVVGNLQESEAQWEARRCLSCGNCFECDNCYGVCPDNAIRKLGKGKRFEIDYEYCKGCGLCAAECPCGAIDIKMEST